MKDGDTPVNLDPSASAAIAVHGDEDREAGAHCGVIAAIYATSALIVFAAGYALAAWIF